MSDIISVDEIDDTIGLFAGDHSDRADITCRVLGRCIRQIAELHAENERLRTSTPSMLKRWKVQTKDKLAELRTENERLKGRLAELADYGIGNTSLVDDASAFWDRVDMFRQDSEANPLNQTEQRELAEWWAELHASLMDLDEGNAALRAENKRLSLLAGEVPTNTLVRGLRSQAEENLERKAENERLRAIVDKLPKTKDGVTASVGDGPFWTLYFERVVEIERVQWWPTGRNSLDCWFGGRSGFRSKGIWRDIWAHIEHCYSTREAAEAAKDETEVRDDDTEGA